MASWRVMGVSGHRVHGLVGRRRPWAGSGGSRGSGRGGRCAGCGHRRRHLRIGGHRRDCCAADGVVQPAPVAGGQVLKGAVVGIGRAVGQRPRGRPRVRRVNAALGERPQRQARRHGRCQPGKAVMHGSKSSSSPARGAGQRPRRTREPDQASRGGPAGSDASGRALGALRLEGRRWRLHGGKHRGRRLARQRHRRGSTRHRRHRAAGGAEVARVGARGTVMVVRRAGRTAFVVVLGLGPYARACIVMLMGMVVSMRL